MYVPPLFEEKNLPPLQDAMRRGGLSTLVTQGPAGLMASHVPLLYDPEPGPYGTLLGHVARANPQWQQAAGGPEALAIFHGPDAYISPSWYPTKKETGKVVPTWNYVAIHAYGPLQTFDDPERLLSIVTRLTRNYETGQAEPWAVSDAPADFIAAQLKAIVGFAIPITRLEGKWKMSQNRPKADRTAVVAALKQEGTPAAAAVAAIVAERDRP